MPGTPSASRGGSSLEPQLGACGFRLSLGWVMLVSCSALLGRSAGVFLPLDASPSSSEQLEIWASLGTVTLTSKSEESGVRSLD